MRLVIALSFIVSRTFIFESFKTKFLKRAVLKLSIVQTIFHNKPSNSYYKYKLVDATFWSENVR